MSGRNLLVALKSSVSFSTSVRLLGSGVKLSDVISLVQQVLGGEIVQGQCSERGVVNCRRQLGYRHENGAVEL